MKDLECFIEAEWGLSGVAINKTLQESGERKVFLIRTVEDAFIVKLFHPELTEEQITRYTYARMFLENSAFCNAPKVIRLSNGKTFTKYHGQYIYLMEFIEGMPLTENPDDEYRLGKALANLHQIDNYGFKAGIDINQEIQNAWSRFEGHPFKKEYDTIVKGLPDFSQLKQCFIHTDICPKNAMKNRNGEIVLIDFDDAGNGSLFIDLGFPLIMQFVQFEGKLPGQPPPDPDKISFHFDAAKSFYEGYYSVTALSNEEKKFIFDGAVFMQLMYMPVFGDEAIPFLWKELAFAISNKSLLMKSLGVDD